MVDDCGFVLYPRVISSIPSYSYTVTPDTLTHPNHDSEIEIHKSFDRIIDHHRSGENYT